MDIVYFGSDVFLSCFEFLRERHRIIALYTYHNEEDFFTEYLITKRAEEYGIPIHYEAVTPDDTIRYFRNGCGLYFVAEYDRIIEIPQELPEFRGTNIHSSVLPEGRSYYPIEAAMERGLNRTGVTLHKLKPRLDSGEVLAQRVFDITPDMDSVDVYLRCAGYAREMTQEVFRDFDAAWDAACTQQEKLPYWKRPPEEKLTLNSSSDRAGATDVFRRYNSMTQVMLGGRWYFVTALQAAPTILDEPERQLADDRWLFRVHDGHLRLCVHPMIRGREGES